MNAPTTRDGVATERVLRRYLDALTAGDVATIADCFAPDATWWLHGDLPLAGARHGREAILALLLDAAHLFAPGTQTFTFGDLLIAGDTAILEWRVTATGAATGRPYENEYAGIFVVRDGRIERVREYLDTAHARDVLYS